MAAKTKDPIRYLSVQEVGAERGVGAEAVRKDIRKGRIRPDSVTGTVRGFTRATVDKYLARYAARADEAAN